MRARKIAVMALLTAIALTIFVLEAQIPLPAPIPGLKLGLSSIVTLVALFALGRKEALAIVLVRIFLGNLFTGQGMALLYSLGGGLLSFLAMALLRGVLKPRQIWVGGVAGGMVHNLGQTAVAVLLLKNPALLYYLPVLLLCGMLTGLFTGLCAQLLTQRLPWHTIL